MNPDTTEADTIEGERMEERNAAVRRAATQVANDFNGLHPTHQAQAYRELSDKAKDTAQWCEERNDKNGVPD